MKTKVLVLGALCLGLTVAAFAQRGPRGGLGNGDGPEARGPGPRAAGEFALGRLASVLDLNEAQTAAAGDLVAQRDAALAAIREEGRTSGEALGELIDAGNDPTAIGNAILARKALRDRATAANDDFVASFRNLLTVTQQEQFDTIREMGRGPIPGFGPRGRGHGPRGFGDGSGDIQ